MNVWQTQERAALQNLLLRIQPAYSALIKGDLSLIPFSLMASMVK